MKREYMLGQLEEMSCWDIIIIGGGATGLGAAVDAATRGYKTLLLEQEDFAKGTSSRSTKLVHGGVRYLAQGNIKLVMDALKERGRLLKNAPHVCSQFSFIIPAYKWWETFYYGIGLKLYDLMAGRLSLGNTNILSQKKTALLLPAIKTTKLAGGIAYKDGQFDDTRLAINLAQTAAENGAAVLNYCRVNSLIKKNGKVSGVVLTDTISRKEYHARGKVVINATGVFTDAVLLMDDAESKPIVSPSQGVHIVLDKKHFPGNEALMIPKTTDGRVLFAVPWYNKVVVGTTDTAIEKISLEPVAMEDEVNFILNNLRNYLKCPVTKADALTVFAGLRPLVKITGVKKTSLMPRDHTILISESGLVSITGGKWTTYRKMAEDVVNKAMLAAELHLKKCVTTELKIHGWTNQLSDTEPLNYYGADMAALKKLYEENEGWKDLLHPDFPYTKACVIWAVRNEMALTIEDVLARRTRLLFLDAGAAIKTAPQVACLMAHAMSKDENWISSQLSAFTLLAKKFLL